MLFAIAGEYDKDVRFKRDSPELRDAFAHAAGGSKVGSQQAYKQAKGMKQDLQDVVGGGSFTAAKKSERKVEDWSKVVDRAPLMQRHQQLNYLQELYYLIHKQHHQTLPWQQM